jgi:hypothetical protein
MCAKASDACCIALVGEVPGQDFALLGDHALLAFGASAVACQPAGDLAHGDQLAIWSDDHWQRAVAVTLHWSEAGLLLQCQYGCGAGHAASVSHVSMTTMRSVGRGGGIHTMQRIPQMRPDLSCHQAAAPHAWHRAPTGGVWGPGTAGGQKIGARQFPSSNSWSDGKNRPDVAGFGAILPNTWTAA